MKCQTAQLLIKLISQKIAWLGPVCIYNESVVVCNETLPFTHHNQQLICLYEDNCRYFANSKICMELSCILVLCNLQTFRLQINDSTCLSPLECHINMIVMSLIIIPCQQTPLTSGYGHSPDLYHEPHAPTRFSPFGPNWHLIRNGTGTVSLVATPLLLLLIHVCCC